MNQIFSALSTGYTSKQILDVLLRQFPQHSGKIKKALASGYTVNQIVKFLGGGRKSLSEDTPSSTEHEATREKDIQRRENVNKGALATAGLAAGSLAAPMAASALSRVLPHSLQSVNPGIQNAIAASMTNPSMQPSQQLQAPSQAIPQKTNLSQQPPILQTNAPSVTQPEVSVQPEIKPLDLAPFKDKYKGFFQRIDDMRKAGNDTSAMTAFFRKFNPSQTAKFEQEAGKPLEEIIEKYVGETPISTNQEKKSPEVQKEEPKQPTISKRDIVAAPQGVGEIKEIRNGQAIIDVDGKLHKVKEDELIRSPIPQKDLADLYEDLLRGIESETGEEVSRNVNVAAYDPNTNSLAYIPHDGALYIYDDIGEEDKSIIENVLKTRKSSGQNHIGAWKEGTRSPIGAQMYELIKKLQSERGGKGKEYARKYEMIYRALSAAEKQHKEKKKKKKP